MSGNRRTKLKGFLVGLGILLLLVGLYLVTSPAVALAFKGQRKPGPPVLVVGLLAVLIGLRVSRSRAAGTKAG